MLHFYQAKMKKGNIKIRGKGSTFQMVQEWINRMKSEGFILLGKIEEI